MVKSKLTQAKETLKQIVDKINGLEEGKIEPFLITTPKGWVIMASDNCKGEKCIFSCLEKHQENSQECFKNGVSHPVEAKLSIGYYCAPGLGGYNQPRYTGCFKIGIEKIYLMKQRDYVYIGNQEYFSVVNALENALNYKDAEISKTVNELIEEYIKSSNDELKKKIENGIGDYFKKNNLNELSVWSLILNREGERIFFGYELRKGRSGSSGRDIDFIQEYWKSTFKITKNYNNKEYTLTFNYGAKS